jgi:hypothetical protein
MFMGVNSFWQILAVDFIWGEIEHQVVGNA